MTRLPRKKDIDTYERRMVRLKFLLKYYHRMKFQLGKDFFMKEVIELEAKIKRSGFTFPYCEYCNAQEHDGNVPS